MGLAFSGNTAIFDATVGVESAEELLAWLRRHPEGNIDLCACTHLHAALVQVLMALGPPVHAWPIDDGLKSWLTTALTE